ncbi:TOTE conflict system archaeo-eukaryotic primase domain-containing protein, partial [Sporosarcina beigongshangi]|uniref:TOTE conflict system archaeo-eukaryotic primase domain-containing protein n=1 Tax=Sporosarcina beigongshangi TaxID=2782538 RepID=UPI002ACE3393
MKNEMEKLRQENLYLKQLLVKMMNRENTYVTGKVVSKLSSVEEKVSLLNSLFKGRKDVYALRWESQSGSSGYIPACALEWQKPICQKPLIKCSQCQHRQLLPLTDQVLNEQLNGEKTIGIYPLLSDGTCTFLAVDFDGSQWKQDVKLFSGTCRKLNVPFHIERSRSGNGAHVWIFFTSYVMAATVRKLGMYLLSKTVERNGGVQLASFDRLFPNQDVLSKGGFGNLIALPLQKGPAQLGNSLFVDEHFSAYPDQWMYLSSVQKMTEQEIQLVLRDHDNVKEERSFLMPDKISVELKNGIHIDKEGIPSTLLEKMGNVASFNNPEFYKAQAKRLSIHGIPRLVQCANDGQKELILPRGCLEELQNLLKHESIQLDISNHSYAGENIDIDFHGNLSMQQDEVVNTLLENDHGTLAATTGFGKTVVATAVMAKRKVNTLVIVHRTQLMKQWVERLATFLGVSPKEIGQIGGGKNHITGKVDVATIQSLNYGGQLKSFITQYGQVIVDECHVISAVTFEKVLQQIRAKYVLIHTQKA